MALAASMLKILVCPLSRGPLEVARGENGEERLFSPVVGVFFPIQDPNIPVLLADEAQLKDGSSAESLIAEWRASQRIS